MNTAANKKDFFYLVVLILTFIIVVLGATYAVFTRIDKRVEGSSRVYTGTFSVEYLSGEIINCNWLKPIQGVDLNDDTNIYKNNFRVTNTGSLKAYYNVVLKIIENDFPVGVLDDGKPNYILWYSIYDDTGLLGEAPFREEQDEVILLTNEELEKKGDYKDYTLVVWIKENGSPQDSGMRKKLLGRILIDASQIKR